MNTISGTLPGTVGRRRIYLMRHGFVDYTSEEVVRARDPSIARLTDRGREEAAAAALALADVDFDIAICSGLRRTRETAEIVLAGHPRDLVLEDEPRLEELHSGQYIAFESAQQLAAVMTFQFEQAGEPGATWLDGGERFADGMARTKAALEDLLRRPGWAQALIVAHEGINRLALTWVLGAPLGASAGFEQDTGCVNIIDFDLTPDDGEGKGGVRIERAVIKALNLTPANYLKLGMNQRSLEAIFVAP